MTAPYLSIIVPAYNEALRITPTLEVLGSYCKRQEFACEIIVVLDGCSDTTASVVRTWMGEHHNVRLLERTQNRGKGFTVREGVGAARGEIILFTDADNSTDIAHFDLMRPCFERGAQVVITSRHPRDAAGACESVQQPWHKRFLGTLGNLLIQLFAVRGIWDTQCGFKAFRAPCARDIFSRSSIDGWGFDIELLAIAQHRNHAIAIIPAHWVDNKETHVTLSSYISVLLETLKIRLNLIRGRYR